MRTAVLTGLMVLGVGLAACGDPAGGVPMGRADSAVAEPAQDSRSVSRKLIRTVDLELAVDDSEGAAKRVQELTGRLGGYVESVDGERVDGALQYAMTLRVPVARLDEAVKDLKQLAVRFEREVLRSHDVTEQYVDLEARLKTLTATEAELQALLGESRERQQDVEDIMVLYAHLTELRTRIEQCQAQLQSLKGKTSFATIHLQLRVSDRATPVVRAIWMPAQTVRRSVRALVTFLQVIADFCIVVGLVVVPIAVVLGLPTWGVIRWWKRARVREQIL